MTMCRSEKGRSELATNCTILNTADCHNCISPMNCQNLHSGSLGWKFDGRLRCLELLAIPEKDAKDLRCDHSLARVVPLCANFVLKKELAEIKK